MSPSTGFPGFIAATFAKATRSRLTRLSGVSSTGGGSAQRSVSTAWT